MSSTSANTQIEHPSKHEQMLLHLSSMLSRALWTPREMTGEEPEALRAIPDDILGPHAPIVASLADAWDAALQDRTAFSIAFAKLFLGPFQILAPPYASFYLEDDQRLMGQVSNSVADLYAQAGLKPGPGPREIPDHAALELEFLYFLTHQWVETQDESWRQMREQFVSDHLVLWMPEFCNAISNASVHEFYDQWCVCLIALLRRFVGDAAFPPSPAVQE